MALVDEIIAEAADEKAPIAGLLRKCLVLAHQLKNPRLKEWVTGELNGYDKGAELPSYRIVQAIAKGHFVGSFGSQVNNQPIPPAALEPAHRSFAQTHYMRQPIAAYFVARDENGEISDGMVEWPPNLVLKYQRNFFSGDYALLRAWQVIPSSVILGLLDTVRTRLLQFALELKDDLGPVSDDPARLSPEKVDRQVINYILGGTNVIAGEARDFAQTTSITVVKNDIVSLQNALDTIGVGSQDFGKLTHAMAEDEKESGNKTLGKRTLEWVAGIGKTVAKEGLKITGDAAKAAAVGWIKQHIGLP